MPQERYDALLLEWMERDRSRYEPAAQIAALLFNINRSKTAKPKTAADFMPPDPRAPKTAVKTGVNTGVAATLAFVKAMVTAKNLKPKGDFANG
jgi:hypothetical protein